MVFLSFYRVRSTVNGPSTSSANPWFCWHGQCFWRFLPGRASTCDRQNERPSIQRASAKSVSNPSKKVSNFVRKSLGRADCAKVRKIVRKWIEKWPKIVEISLRGRARLPRERPNSRIERRKFDYYISESVRAGAQRRKCASERSLSVRGSQPCGTSSGNLD